MLDWLVCLALVAFGGFSVVALGFEAVLVALRLPGCVLPAFAGLGSRKVNSKVRPIARVCGGTGSGLWTDQGLQFVQEPFDVAQSALYSACAVPVLIEVSV